MTLTHLAGRVWLYPHDPDGARTQPCVAVIDLGDRSVLVDAGNGPAHARAVRVAVQEQALPPVATIVFTHHHWDHVWGASEWDADDIVGHAAGAELLREDARRPWSTAYAEEVVRDNPRMSLSVASRRLAVPDWSELDVRPPTRTFDDELVLGDGLVARHVGGKHAPDSTIVIDSESGVALLGDSFYPPPFHLRDEHSATDFAMLRDFVRLPVEWLVDAHGPPRRSPSTRR
jgi:glyoxylase-like metal-dependent hydrolase (beta-lactamase superfamily II)